MELSYLLTILVVFTGGILVGATALLAEAKRRKQMAANMRECAEINNIVLTNKRLVEESERLHTEIASLKKRELAFKKQVVDLLKMKAQVSLLQQENKSQRAKIEQQARNENARFGVLMRELLKHGIDLPTDLLNEITP